MSQSAGALEEQQPDSDVENARLNRDHVHTFLYDPIPGKDSIRLLELHPGLWDDSIECTLSAIDLDSTSQPFEAISYAWGDANKRREIICNGASLSITESLFEALQVFRSHPSTAGARFLWADGVCIDQANTEERSHQVQLMRRVYSGASKVLVWLGHADDQITRAGLDLVCQTASREMPDEERGRPPAGKKILDLVCQFASQRLAAREKRRPPAGKKVLDLVCQFASRRLEAREKRRLAAGKKIGPSTTISKPYYLWHADRTNSCEAEIVVPSQPSVDLGDIGPMLSMMQCRWFERLWVIQELALSCSAEAYWGSGSIDFMLICWASIHVFNLPDVRPKVHRCVLICAMWTWGRSAYSFFDILCTSRFFNTTDPRDKAFGLLGLSATDSDPERSLFIEPDYAMSKAEVYRAVATKLLVENQNVDGLSAVQHGRSVRDDWTSWVPDWTTRWNAYLWHDGRQSGANLVAVVSIPSCSICARNGYDSISLRGIIVHTVTSLEDGELVDNTGEWHEGLIEAFGALLKRHDAQQNTETLEDTVTAEYRSSRDLLRDRHSYMAQFQGFVANDDQLEQHRYQRKTEATAEDVHSETHHLHVARQFASGRRFFVTETGLLSLGPVAIAEGDIIAVIFGGSVPFVLRPSLDTGHYRLVGECYIHDVMDGQAVRDWQNSGEPAIDFHLF